MSFVQRPVRITRYEVAILRWGMRCGLKVRSFCIASALVCIASHASARDGAIGEITYASLIQAASKTHPAIRVASLAADASKSDVTALERRRWPAISLAVEAASNSHIGVPSQVLSIEQILWDFGLLGAQITEAEQNVLVAQTSVEIERRRIFVDIASALQNFISSTQRQLVAREALEALNGYRERAARRVHAEVAPSIDIELVESRILGVRVDLISAQQAYAVAKNKLIQLTAIHSLADSTPGISVREMWADAEKYALVVQSKAWQGEIKKHPLVLRSQIQAKGVAQKLEAKKSERWPQVYLRVSQPVDTGTGVATSRNMEATAYLGMRYVPGAGFSTSAEVAAMVLRLDGAENAIQVSFNEAAEAITLDAFEFESAYSRYQSQKLAVDSAAKVLKSHEKQFDVGRKSWQDMLNAVRDLTAAQYAQAEALASTIGAMYRLQARTGQYEVVQ